MSVTLKIVLLAILQGLTEFLPVSSSGHLVLGKHLVGLETPSGPFLEVILHAGTLLSIVLYYRAALRSLAQGLWRRNRKDLRFAGLILLACVPAILVYMALGSRIEALFDMPAVAATMLCVNGLVLFSLQWAPTGSNGTGVASMALMGVAQAVAMIPGISRSGSTIATARWCRVKPETAAAASFMMVMPLLAGAALLKLLMAVTGTAGTTLPAGGLLLGFLLAALSGYAALALLVRLLAHRLFYLFGVYCLVVGIGSFILQAVL